MTIFLIIIFRKTGGDRAQGCVWFDWQHREEVDPAEDRGEGEQEMFQGLYYFYVSRFSGPSCVDIQCCDHLTGTDLLLPSSRVKYEPGDSQVKFETSLPRKLIMEKYQEMQDNDSQNITFNIDVSKEELLLMAHQASKTP